MKMIKRRNAYLRTLEAFLAFFITFIFVVFVVLKAEPTKSQKPTLDVLEAVEEHNAFRECVYAENITCMEDYVESYVPITYNYQISIGPDPPRTARNIFTETVFITGNQTKDYKEVYLYYWVIG